MNYKSHKEIFQVLTNGFCYGFSFLTTLFNSSNVASISAGNRVRSTPNVSMKIENSTNQSNELSSVSNATNDSAPRNC